ncbi:hypothetical protein CJ030_MR5G011898 [Morella rubra]|uniref:Uncharacterized protein n=2 Tax=Morella rubra TaxID=262757 RepID=A0A6A1VLV5_9ROSI|nr:hypothetical protein CJ030_MR5G011898 [Morella rubra]
MESSQMLGGTEECHSSESGWTMYIGSPTYDDDDSDENRHSAADGNDAGSDDDDDDDDDKNEANRDEDSDDSMASDASSGPSHQGHPCGSGKYGHGPADFGYDGEENDNKYRLGGKANKQQKDKENQRAPQRIKKEKEEKVFEADKTTAPGQSGSKVRKNMWRGKGK